VSNMVSLLLLLCFTACLCTVYVGSLLNGVLKEMIASVLSIVEFSVDDCLCLHRLLASVISASTDLFHRCHQSSIAMPVEVTIHNCVPVWPRFRELTSFFQLGLGQVMDRWTDGKGPLAMQLSAAELARLVVAVFEKTSRRDAFIAQLAAAAAAASDVTQQ